ncbi:MFS transporter, partial [Pseudomonas aeruginosa]|nr:MFS transporter [Pseudomonas aeruginosa]
GRLTASLGRYKPLILLGAVLLPCGIAGLALVPVGDHWLSGLCMLLTGIAIGTQFPTSLVAAQNAVEQRHIGVATSNATLFRSLGGAVGVALMSAILLALLKHLRIGGGLDQGFSESALLSSLDAASGPARVILQHVLADAFKVLFLVNAAVALLGLAVASALPDMTLRGRGATQPAAGE